MHRPLVSSFAALALLAACTVSETPPADSATATTAAATDTTPVACPGDNGGLTLPAGFCATVFADSVGGARHIAVAPNGDLFAQLIVGKKSAESGSGRTGGILAMRDTNGDGVADTSAYFGSLGGTGIGLAPGYVYADDKRRIVRYPIAEGSLTPSGPAEAIVTSLPTGGHEARNFVLDGAGALYVNVGSLTNSCQVKDRGNESPGHNPCTELETRAGIWKFDAGKAGQTQAAGERVATGIRNAMGLAIAPTDRALWATQHGRDQLLQNWAKLYDAKQSAENPAEELVRVQPGDDFGWPYCYWSVDHNRRVLAPEYGGDGGQKIEQCAQKKAPVATFPGHWAPMALLFYTGSSFPARYRDGAFITFHGSWNRAPEPQAGFRVVFQPLANMASSGAHETFADGFTGATTPLRDTTAPGISSARHRPIGLAQGPDGALYISDDTGGRIWKVTYGRR